MRGVVPIEDDTEKPFRKFDRGMPPALPLRSQAWEVRTFSMPADNEFWWPTKDARPCNGTQTDAISRNERQIFKTKRTLDTEFHSLHGKQEHQQETFRPI